MENCGNELTRSIGADETNNPCIELFADYLGVFRRLSLYRIWDVITLRKAIIKKWGQEGKSEAPIV